MQSVYLLEEYKPPRTRLDGTGRETIERTVAGAYAVPVREIRTSSRGRASVAFARQVAMYLAHVALGQNYSAIGRAFGRDRTTVAHACRLVEDRRDDPRTDNLLKVLEAALGVPAGRFRA
jgi:chromosomal replication initiation ATPase DnaA